ncbi:hypothetical protein [Hyunsoonleella pacifica]|uniref:Uncharacterized protein n=1 Tax=Hyunsoonleella pacifica TaxID=1080224 RepID=A0A4Q9FSL7_9FLAO|nr:hypothetical protein [Hyunsoonleella pacifica]TBN19003.1 hypothetical protein EYD46_02760 [Hyunsoonleella pacifica]GGD06545.1 hypothetical protein GCM10011368_05500 [Hyunsoonleella pacifica]
MRKLVILLFSIFSLSTFGQEISCSDYKTGNFEYDDILYSEWRITRTNAEQIETNATTGLIIHNDIKWLSDCEFTLTCSKVSQKKYEHAVGKIFKVVITDTSNDGYTCVMMHNEIQPNDLRFKMVIVE